MHYFLLIRGEHDPLGSEASYHTVQAITSLGTKTVEGMQVSAESYLYWGWAKTQSIRAQQSRRVRPSHM